jgi:hypothetical protein
MYATIRRYTLRDPSRGQEIISGLKQRIEKGYVPKIQDVPGFHGYYVVNANDREMVSISIFDTAAGAKESTKRAAEFVKNDPAKDQLGGPDIVEGELVLSKEATVGAH